jgi:hypothetical protein
VLIAIFVLKQPEPVPEMEGHGATGGSAEREPAAVES